MYIYAGLESLQYVLLTIYIQLLWAASVAINTLHDLEHVSTSSYICVMIYIS